MAEHERRLALVRVSGSAFLGLLTHGTTHPLTMEGLPADAQFHHAYYDHERRCFMLYVESASFDPVPDNCHPPILAVKVTVEGFVGDDNPPLDAPLPEISRVQYAPGVFYTGL